MLGFRNWKILLIATVMSLVTGCVKQCSSESSKMGSTGQPTNDQITISVNQEFENLNPIISQMAVTSYLQGFSVRAVNSINKDWKWECILCKSIPTLENGQVRIFDEKGVKKVQSTWEIKEEAKWGDGAPVTGHDFKLAWQIGSSDNVAVGEKKNYTRIQNVEVNADNPKIFTITHDKAYYDYYSLSNANIGFIPSHLEASVWEKTKGQPGAYEKQTTYSTDPLNPGLYNGPYRVSELKLGSHLIFTPNEHFFGQAPNIKRVIIKLIPNTQTMEANLFAGNVDMLSIYSITFDQALTLQKKLESDPSLQNRYKVEFREGLVYEHIDLNLRKNKDLQDIRVRQALKYSLDREKLTTALFEGKQKPALHNIHPADVYYTEDVQHYPHNPEKAAKLLEEAGWKLGADGYRYKDGKKLNFVLMTTAQNKTRELVQVFLQSEWKKVGIDVELRNEPARVFFGETVRKAEFPAMAMFAWVSSPDNPPRSTLHSSMIPTAANSFSGQNSPGWANAKVDAALDQVELEFDINKRKELMKTVLQEYNKDIPVIPLYLRSDVAVVPTNLKNFHLTGHQFADSGWSEYWSLN